MLLNSVFVHHLNSFLVASGSESLSVFTLLCVSLDFEISSINLSRVFSHSYFEGYLLPFANASHTKKRDRRPKESL